MKQEDKILQMFFEPQRWQYAIGKGVDKDIRKDQLIKLTKPEMSVCHTKRVLQPLVCKRTIRLENR